MNKIAELENNSVLHKGCLSNGVELWLLEDHHVPAVATHSWLRCGSIHERTDGKLGRTGLAHLFEHLMFRGTARFKDGEFDKILTELGSHDSNATTWLERTHYYQYVPKENIERVVDLERDRLTNISLTQEVFEVERKAVLSEYHLGQDDPEIVGYHHLYDQAYTSHPYKFGTIGTEEDIHSFTLQQAEYFYSKFYSAGNLILFFAGDLYPQEFFDLISKYYGDLSLTGRAVCSHSAEPLPKKQKVFEFSHSQITNLLLILGYHSPSINEKDHAAMIVLRSLLCSGQRAILNRKVIDAGIASAVEADVDQFSDPGLFSMSFDLNAGKNVEQVLEIFDQLKEEFSGFSPTQWELELTRSKNQIKLSQFDFLSDPHSLATWMGEFIISAQDPLRGMKLLKEVEAISRDDVFEILEKYIRNDRRVCVIGKADQK